MKLRSSFYMAELWTYSGTKVMLGSPAMRVLTKIQAGSRKTKSLGKPREALVTVDPIPRHLGRAEAIARFRLTTGHDFSEVYLHWLDLASDEAFSLSGHARTTCSNALDSMHTRLKTSSVGTGKLGVKTAKKPKNGGGVG
ncbi:hypothetical protein TNCV_2759031 [Trichonephila clavipes]|nr:hypothetical protein TNCV_2759031 [Trichonephila clavipes]